MARIFCIANQKGGVGKTTTTVNLAAGLAKVGQRVLMIDLDPQGNATMGSGVDKRQLTDSVYDVLLGSTPIAQAQVRSDKLESAGCGYAVLGANRDLAGAEVELVGVERRERRLKTALAEVEADYDFVLIDCPPTINMLTLNALTAADGVLIPIQCEFYALEGLSALLETVKQVRNTVNPELNIEGLLRTMYDPRNRLATDVSAELEKLFRDKVYKTLIPRNVRLAEAPSFGLPALLHDRSSRGAQAYMELAAEVLADETAAGAADSQSG